MLVSCCFKPTKKPLNLRNANFTAESFNIQIKKSCRIMFCSGKLCLAQVNSWKNILHFLITSISQSCYYCWLSHF